MARHQSDLSFATFNLYNLHLPGHAIYNNKLGWSEEEYATKIEWIAGRLKALDADVIAFEECWNATALKQCFEAAGLLDGYDLVARTTKPAGIQVALAARKGLITGTPKWTEKFPKNATFIGLREARDAKEKVSVSIGRFSRPPLRVVIQPRGTKPRPPPVTIYVAHLKSKGPANLSFTKPIPAVQRDHASVAMSVVSHVRRLVEAGALRILLNEEMRGNQNPFVLIGDLNDSSLSVSTELLTAQPGYRFIEKSRAGSKSDLGFYTVEKLQQLRSFRHVYYTHIYQQSMESLDHILVSDAFYDHSIARKWSFNEMVIYNDHLAVEDPRERTRLGYNDHGIVRAQFDWNPMAAALKT